MIETIVHCDICGKVIQGRKYNTIRVPSLNNVCKIYCGNCPVDICDSCCDEIGLTIKKLNKGKEND